MIKRKITVTTVILSAVFVILLFCCLKPCKTYEYEGNRIFVTGAEAQECVYKGISLPPGVYRVELEYRTDKDLVAYATVSDNTVITGGLLTNFENFYSHLGRTNFEIWVFEKTDDLHLDVHYNGEGSLYVGSLVIHETHNLWTMIMTVYLFAWCAGFAVRHLIRLNAEQRLSREKKIAIFWLSGIVLVSSVPFLSGLSIPAGDLGYHLSRIEGVKDGLLSGQIPVRIEPKWLYNHGYASGVFYCDLFLLFPALLRMVGFPVTLSYNVYCILVNIATACVSYGCLRKIFRGNNVGLACSALYTLSLNRIYKMCEIAVVGEYTAMIFLPLILYGLCKVFTEDHKTEENQNAWMALAFGLAGVLQSHVLTCEMTAGIIIIFCLCYIRKIFIPRTFLMLLKAAAMTILLSLWFLVPFVDYYLTQDIHVKHVSGRTIQADGLEVSDLYVFFVKVGRDAPDRKAHFCCFGGILILCLAVFLGLWITGCLRKAQEKDKRLYSFGILTMLLGFGFLAMSLSVFPWDQIQKTNALAATLVSNLQFPNRFLGWATLCAVYAFGCCVYYLQNNARTVLPFVWFLVGTNVMTSGMYLIDYSICNTDTYTIYNPAGMGYGYISGMEYLIEGTDYDALSYAQPRIGEGTEVEGYEPKCLGAVLTCKNTGNKASWVELPLMLYRGYRAKDMESKRELEIIPGENQEVCVLIPQGYAGSFRVKFIPPWYWRFSEIISFATISIFIIRKTMAFKTRNAKA